MAEELEIKTFEDLKNFEESRMFKALARREKAEARKAKAEAKQHESIVADLKDTAKREAASDDENRVYQFAGAVTESSVKSCITALTRWHRLDPGCDITIVFNSPGGSVIDGFALWDYLTYLKAEGHYLTTVCQGMAASMGGILLQAGHTRIMGAESVLLVHEISFGVGGKMGEIEDEVAFAKMLTKRVLNIFAKRTNLTADQIARRWARKDWWLNSDESLRLGFVDQIR